jgi:transposase
MAAARTAAEPGGRPRKTDMRAVMNAIVYLLRTGCPWRYLPQPRGCVTLPKKRARPLPYLALPTRALIRPGTLTTEMTKRLIAPARRSEFEGAAVSKEALLSRRHQ